MKALTDLKPEISEEIFIKKRKALDPLIWDSAGIRHLYWQMHNIPGGFKFKLS